MMGMVRGSSEQGGSGASPADRRDAFDALARTGTATLADQDPVLHGLLAREHERQSDVLTLIASTSLTHPSVLACEATTATNVTAEGYPGNRFHAGSEVFDEIEHLAVERAKEAFGARFANVQPHSASIANLTILLGFLRPGDALLGMHLDAGGHLSHGARASMSGQVFRAVGYGVTEDGVIDYDAVRSLALEHRPRLIICGTTSYPRLIDFARFRAIADEVGALVLADISHIAGLVVAGLHPSPIDHAHFTTTCTHKQLCGPRGGLILLGRDADTNHPDRAGTLGERVQRAVFPLVQGAPFPAQIAARARVLSYIRGAEFTTTARLILDDARALAAALGARGYRVITGGTETHLVVIDVTARGLTGAIAERALEECGIIVNRNRLPGDSRPARIGSGIRLGTNVVAGRGLGPREMDRCAELIDRVLSAVTPGPDQAHQVNPETRESVRETVGELCRRFPISWYPRAAGGIARGTSAEAAPDP